jgi:hypothetical protein
MDEHDKWMNRFSNIWHAGEEEKRFIHSIEPIIEDLNLNIEEGSDIPTAGKPKIEPSKDWEEWLEKFANQWQASEKEDSPITEPNVKMEVSETREVSVDKSQKEASLDREAWLEKFANHWLACGKDEARFKTEVEVSKNLSNTDKYSKEVLTEVGNGKVVIDDSLLHVCSNNSNQLNEEDSDKKEFNPNPDDLIVFDIDPEIAIKLLTATRGVGL